MPGTLKLRADSAADIERAAGLLREGGTVAFPTETVYGLGANALDATAVRRIFTAKQRPSWDPLIVHVAEPDQIASLLDIDIETEQRLRLLSAAFWPGPLTLLLPKNDLIPTEVTAGRPLVGIRLPAHPTAQTLLRAAGIPIAAPSANTFGHTSPTTAAHVLADLDGRIDAVVDGGATPVGVESTVVDPTQTPIILYRPGAVTADEISAVTGVPVLVHTGPREAAASFDALPSPGFGIRHYAPRAKVVLIEGDEREFALCVGKATGRIGVLLPTTWSAGAHEFVQSWGNWNKPEDLAANLFAGLRALDERGAQVIYVPLPEPGGLNDAIRDRLMKAARPV